MKIRFLFYRASQERWNIVGHAIALYTALLPMNWGNWKYWYSHVEVWFPDYPPKGNGCDENMWTYPKFLDAGEDGYGRFGEQFMGECFSSTTRGDAEGTRFIPANKLLKHPERWDYIECECDKVQEVYDWCKTQTKKKYDYWGLFGFLSPFNIQDKKKWYCSEVAARIIWKLNILPILYERISPRRLASKLAKKYHEPIRLVAASAAKGKK